MLPFALDAVMCINHLYRYNQQRRIQRESKLLLAKYSQGQGAWDGLPRRRERQLREDRFPNSEKVASSKAERRLGVSAAATQSQRSGAGAMVFETTYSRIGFWSKVGDFVSSFHLMVAGRGWYVW